MSKIFAILVYRWPLPDGMKDPKLVSVAYELSSFSIIQRNSIKEWINFISKTLLQNSKPAERQTVFHDEYACHVNVRHDGLSGIMISDKNYAPRSAFLVLQQILNDFFAKYNSQLDALADPRTPQIDYPKLKEALVAYQNPASADKIAEVQQLIDDTTIIMHRNIEAALKNKDSIESLVDKSEDLSRHSKVFFKQAKKANRCCIIS